MDTCASFSRWRRTTARRPHLMGRDTLQRSDQVPLGGRSASKATRAVLKMQRPSPSWKALLDFLDQPAVAVRIAERRKTVVGGPPGVETGVCPCGPKWKGSLTSTPR